MAIWKHRGPTYTAAGPTAAEFGWATYIKGAARSSVALMLAHTCLSRNLSLQALRPGLWNSLCPVQCKMGSMSNDIISVAMLNASLSSRGSIRRAHDVVTWTSKLQVLKVANCDPANIIRRWNSECTAGHKLEGQKRVALNHLLQYPEEVCNALLGHASRCGNDRQCFRSCSLVGCHEPPRCGSITSPSRQRA